jgi:hypothetical protein
MTDFWQVHGIWFLLGMVCFPRLTMLFAVNAPFGVLAWIGWLVWPSLLAAILATNYYWDTNPVLCVFAWLFVVVKTGGTAERSQRRRR